MKLRIITAAIFIFICFENFAQTPDIKKQTQITYDYSIIDDKGKPSLDTLIREFDINGVEIYSNKHIYVVKSIETVKSYILDSSNQKIIKQYVYSDSSLLTSIQNNYKDSIVFFYIKKNDTISTETHYFTNKKMTKTIIKNNQGGFYPCYIETNLIKNNLYKKKSNETKQFFKDGLLENKKVCYNKLFRVEKQYLFNDSTKKWFVFSQEKYNRKGQLIKVNNQTYHDYHNQYYKTFTKYKYNSFGQLYLELTKDHFRKIENKIIYFYEYH